MHSHGKAINYLGRKAWALTKIYGSNDRDILIKSAFKRTKGCLKQLTHLLNSQRMVRLTESNDGCISFL